MRKRNPTQFGYRGCPVKGVRAQTQEDFPRKIQRTLVGGSKRLSQRMMGVVRKSFEEKTSKRKT
jgi:hypothetical protein